MLNFQDHKHSLGFMPQELLQFTLSNCVSASPYNRGGGGSFYSTSTKTWVYTEDGTIRVSDHWNFYSRGTTHCITDIDNSKLIGKWVVAQYNASSNTYTVISADEKNESIVKKIRERIIAKSFVDPLLVNKQKREHVLADIRAKRRKLAREKKIINRTLWVEFETNIWSKSRGRFTHQGTSSHLGQLLRETSCTITVLENGKHINTYKNVVGYRELNRKPVTKKATV